MVHASPRVPRRVRPEAKVTAAGVGGAAVVALVHVAGLFGAEVPETVATAAVALVAAVAGWLAPHTPRPDLADDGEGV